MWLLVARNAADGAGIDWPEAPTLGQKWALAILSPEVQFQDGYCKFLVQHLNQVVGFTCVQRRIWKEEAIVAGKRRRTRNSCPAPEEEKSHFTVTQGELFFIELYAGFKSGTWRFKSGFK